MVKGSILGEFRCFLRVWKWTKERLPTEEFNSKLLLARDNEGKTAWHWAAYQRNLDVQLKGRGWAEEN